MTPVSKECARSDRDCRKCSFENCGCDCHKPPAHKVKNWHGVLSHHNQKRYYMAPGKSGIWYVMDRGTLKSTSTKIMAKCKNRLDAWKILQALLKAEGK